MLGKCWVGSNLHSRSALPHHLHGGPGYLILDEPLPLPLGVWGTFSVWNFRPNSLFLSFLLHGFLPVMGVGRKPMAVVDKITGCRKTQYESWLRPSFWTGCQFSFLRFGSSFPRQQGWKAVGCRTVVQGTREEHGFWNHVHLGQTSPLMLTICPWINCFISPNSFTFSLHSYGYIALVMDLLRKTKMLSTQLAKYLVYSAAS